MNKKELLNQLQKSINSGDVTKEEIINELSIHSKFDQSNTKDGFQITKVLYILGGIVVVVGIILLISQVWGQLGSFGRVGITFGVGVCFNILSLFLLKDGANKSMGAVYSCIGGLLIPIGLFVLINEFQAGGVLRMASFVAVAVSYAVLSRVYKYFTLSLFAVVHATVAIYLLLYHVNEVVLGEVYGLNTSYNYLTILVGISYLLLSLVFAKDWNSKLVPLLNFFGVTAFLGGAFSLVFNSPMWQLTFVAMLIASFILSVHMKSKAILIVSNAFVVFFISYISSEYFASSVLGWPLTLVILGSLFIGLGYGSVLINKKYIKK